MRTYSTDGNTNDPAANDAFDGSHEVRSMGADASPEFASLVQQVRRNGKADA